MATLKCNSCGGNIASAARRVQCPHCGELFPFACARCQRKLRPPFNVFDDERYLTLDTPPLPLCDDHYLRQCPDCERWYGADENPGYFRCALCAEIHRSQQAQQELQAPEIFESPVAARPHGGGVATKNARQLQRFGHSLCRLCVCGAGRLDDPQAVIEIRASCICLTDLRRLKRDNETKPCRGWNMPPNWRSP